MTDTEIGKMEEAAKKRRERLLAMKRKMEKAEKKKDQTEIKEPQLKFRSYQSENQIIKENQMERVEAPDITEHIQVHLEKEKEPLEVDIDLYKLAPKKPDWDLKRNIEKKMEKLEKKTSQAISEMVREKLQRSAMENNRINTRGMPENIDISDDSE